jgi:hypothetical protein
LPLRTSPVWGKPKPADAGVDPDRVANPTDPDSGIMKTRRGWVQGYNAQAVVTPQQIILAAEVTPMPTTSSSSRRCSISPRPWSRW